MPSLTQKERGLLENLIDIQIRNVSMVVASARALPHAKDSEEGFVIGVAVGEVVGQFVATILGLTPERSVDNAFYNEVLEIISRRVGEIRTALRGMP